MTFFISFRVFFVILVCWQFEHKDFLITFHVFQFKHKKLFFIVIFLFYYHFPYISVQTQGIIFYCNCLVLLSLSIYFSSNTRNVSTWIRRDLRDGSRMRIIWSDGRTMLRRTSLKRILWVSFYNCLEFYIGWGMIIWRKSSKLWF